MDNTVVYQKGKCSFIGWIHKRLKNQNNALILVYGPTGSGKSRACIEKAIEVDSTFNEKQIVFNFTEFMEIINAPWFKEKKIKQIIFEETQTSMNARNWQHLINKLINYLLSTFRATQIIVWFNCPYKDFLDSQSMKLIHATLETKGINRETNECHLRLCLEEYNSAMKKYYHHPLYVRHKKGFKKLTEISAKLPPKEIDDAYEQKKRAFNDKTNASILAKVRKVEKAEKEETEDAPKQKENPFLVREMTIAEEESVKLYRQGLTVTEIAKRLRKSTPAVSKLLTNAKKRGISVEREQNLLEIPLFEQKLTG